MPETNTTTKTNILHRSFLFAIEDEAAAKAAASAATHAARERLVLAIRNEYMLPENARIRWDSNSSVHIDFELELGA